MDMKVLFQQCGYHDFQTMYWKKPEDPYLETALMALEKDKDVTDMVVAALKANKINEMDLFNNHSIDFSLNYFKILILFNGKIFELATFPISETLIVLKPLKLVLGMDMHRRSE
ncbi:unnamed protein product [Lupinus luteus]|uniref:PB1-like domain-containing protein n=1 Tax=Lupinus luteus TaxID=3873 RepID=A0AAV1W0Y0_LUPLU